MPQSHIDQYFEDAVSILKKMDRAKIEAMIQIILGVRRDQGRLFCLGVGGSAANCSHAVNDFRKIAGLEAYAPTDNVSELTARTNDEGWATVFAQWLKGSHLAERDAVFVFSVGGGSKEKNISTNLVYALEYAKKQKTKILGVAGRDGGFLAAVADACLIVPTVNPGMLTPHTEAMQAFVWHLIVSDPRIMQHGNKWESVAGK